MCQFVSRRTECTPEPRRSRRTSRVSPERAAAAVTEVRHHIPELSWVRVSGPGDPFAHPEPALRTLALVKEAHPDLSRSVTTNGVGLARYVDALDVEAVDLSMNTFDPGVASRAYPWVRADGTLLRGAAAGEHVVIRQVEAICALVDRGIDVRIDAVMRPGIGLGEVASFASAARELGVNQVSWSQPAEMRTRAVA